MTGATHVREGQPRPWTRSLAAITPPSTDWLPTAAVALVVIGLAFNGGSFGVTTRNPVAVAIWWLLALGVLLSLFPLARVTKAALAAGALLTAFAALAGLSVIWAANAEGAFDDFTRDALYVGVFAVGVLAVRRGDARRWVDGIALGITGVAILALVARLFPHLIPDSRPVGAFAGDVRPSWPIDYWNGLAVFTALAFPGLLRMACGSSGRALRSLPVAAAPALAALLYLTSSRTGVITVVVGIGCFVLLTDDRVRATVAVVAGAIGSAVAVAVLVASPRIVDGPLDSAAAAREGRLAALAILGACLLSGLVHAALAAREIRVPQIPRRWRRPLVAAGAALLVVAVIAADPAARFESFKKPPVQLGQRLSNDPYAQTHLLSGGGNGRWQFWSAAVDEWKAHPVLGGGSGSYAAWWDEHASLTYVTRDAHSLYLEALAELGPLGLLILLAMVAVGVVTGWRRARASARAARPAASAAAATFIAFAVAAGLDWMWEIPGVTVIGVLALALVTGAATSADGGRPHRYLWARLGFIAVALAVIVAEMIPLLAQTDIRSSRSAASRGDVSLALSKARDARGVQPWAASPYLQEALVQEQAGRLTDAQATIHAAIARDRTDWQLWYVSARIESEAGAVASARHDFAEAVRLNPRSRLLTSLKGRLATQ